MRTPSHLPAVASVAMQAALAMAITSCGRPPETPACIDITHRDVVAALKDDVKPAEATPDPILETGFVFPRKKSHQSPYEGADCVMSSGMGSEELKNADGEPFFQGKWMLCRMATPPIVQVGEEADWVATIATSDTYPLTSCEPLARTSYRPSHTSSDRGLYQIRCLGESMSGYERRKAEEDGVPYFGAEGEKCQGTITVSSAKFYGAQSMWTPFVEGPYRDQWDSKNGGAFIPPWMPSDEHDRLTPSVVEPFILNDGGVQKFTFKGGLDKCRVTFMTYGNAKASVSFP